MGSCQIVVLVTKVKIQYFRKSHGTFFITNCQIPVKCSVIVMEKFRKQLLNVMSNDK